MSDTLENTTSMTGIQDPDNNGAGNSSATQANLHLLLASAFSLPGEMKPEFPEQLAGLISELPAALQDPVCALAREWEQTAEDGEALALAYARLFLGPFEIFASPYASFYLEPEQRVMGDVSLWVASRYSEAGLEPGKGIREVPDHVALECEFMYYLLFQSITEGQSERNEQIRCFLDHMRQWIPPFANAVRKAGQHPFYAAAVNVLEILIDSEPV